MLQSESEIGADSRMSVQDSRQRNAGYAETGSRFLDGQVERIENIFSQQRPGMWRIVQHGDHLVPLVVIQVINQFYVGPDKPKGDSPVALHPD